MWIYEITYVWLMWADPSFYATIIWLKSVIHLKECSKSRTYSPPPAQIKPLTLPVILVVYPSPFYTQPISVLYTVNLRFIHSQSPFYTQSISVLYTANLRFIHNQFPFIFTQRTPFVFYTLKILFLTWKAFKYLTPNDYLYSTTKETHQPLFRAIMVK